jgi:GT2 family glycosyltransferase
MGDSRPGGEADVEANEWVSSRPPETIAVIIPTALKKARDGRPFLAACLESLLPAVESPRERASDGGPRVREIVIVTQGRPFEDPVLGRLRSNGVELRQLDVLGVFRTAAFRLVGDFDESYPSALGDTDFCLRLRRSGRRLVCTPRASVIHAESSTRDPKVPGSAFRRFQRMHPEVQRDDPLLPPLALPLRVRVARSFVRPLRGAYRATIKRLVPRDLHLRLWRAAVSHGWVR